MTYALDVPGARLTNILWTEPLPDYPFAVDASQQQSSSWLAFLFPVAFHDWSLRFAVPFTFAVLYYSIAHSANEFQRGHDRSKGNTFAARSLRAFVVFHNAALCLYSLFTFLATAPVVVDLFVQGYRAAGHDGLSLALCSIPTNNRLLGRWVYLFYLSKYYEVVDSIILYLKGKKIGNLQSYQQAGALFSMWIAYRFRAQPVWVFVVFNSGVHTLMYAYYFCSALKLPFPKALKRNLTTLQIVQIASGTVIVNTYYVHNALRPAYVHSMLVQKGIKSALPSSLFGFDALSSVARSSSSSSSSPSWYTSTFAKTLFGTTATSSQGGSEALMQLSTYAHQRSLYAPPAQRNVCIETTGTAAAIAVNTLYMAPLLVLFANFYIASYMRQQSSKPATKRVQQQQQQQQGKSNGNGHIRKS